MNVGRAGIWSVELRLGDRGEISERAAELDELGYGALWIPGLGGGDVLGDSERLLKATRDLTVATGILSIWQHGSDEVAAGHHRLQQTYGRRLITGLGVSDPAAAAGAGRPFRPVADMNAYLDRLDSYATPLPPHERVLAALGPKLLDVAARRTGGVHTFLATPESTAATRRSLGPTPFLAPYQAVVLDPDSDTARTTARGFLAPFIGMAHYARSLRRQGFTDSDLAGGGSDHLIDSVVAWGDAEAIGKRVQAQHDAGADHVALHVITTDGGFPRHQWRELAPLTR
ncbi:putative F420-dependent oxidoreductase [Streptomyces sp. 846.5]|nr:TIGR03620 family F420-dependent LLM class oxidoreductase [Streptomyces sp. 846.5]TDT98252.1 putative F420-dependent oxidoreductase [Streptomyces sp. 846.5]